MSWIGIGSYGIGGRGHRDVSLTEKKSDRIYIDSLQYQFKRGYNFTEISLGYGHGNACRLFSEAMKGFGIDRTKLFITNSLYPRDFNLPNEVERDVDEMHRIFDTDYFDSTLVTQSLTIKYGYDKIVSMLHKLLESGRTRFVSLSNAGKNFIKKFKKEFGDSLFAHETHLSFEVRINQDAGIFDTCDKLGIVNIIWRPLRRNMSSKYSWDLLVELSKKYKKTQNQIILNWIAHLECKPMVMSTSKAHIDENWEANSFTMEDWDYERIQNFRVPNFEVPEIDWDKKGEGIGMADFAIGFDDNYKDFKSSNSN